MLIEKKGECPWNFIDRTWHEKKGQIIAKQVPLEYIVMDEEWGDNRIMDNRIMDTQQVYKWVCHPPSRMNHQVDMSPTPIIIIIG